MRMIAIELGYQGPTDSCFKLFLEGEGWKEYGIETTSWKEIERHWGSQQDEGENEFCENDPSGKNLLKVWEEGDEDLLDNQPQT